MNAQKFKIISTQSNINWVGKKVTGSHNGTIAVKDGEIVLKDGKLASGKIVVDTTSVKILDITDPATNAQFAGHLASDDFFSSDKYPEAVLEMTGTSGNYVEADLTIKGISHPIVFNVAVGVSGDLLTATGRVVIDRTKYGMRFRSGNFFKDLGDTLIYNDFELDVVITASSVLESVSAR